MRPATYGEPVVTQGKDEASSTNARQRGLDALRYHPLVRGAATKDTELRHEAVASPLCALSAPLGCVGNFESPEILCNVLKHWNIAS